MELTHTYKNKIGVTGFRTSVRKSLLTFIDKNAQVFEGLSRSTTPFGGNWLSATEQVTEANPVSPTEVSIANAQRQINELTQLVNRLRHELTAIQASVQHSSTPTKSVLTDTEL